MGLSQEQRQRKLKQLASDEGFDSVVSMLEAASGDSVAPGICVSPDCHYTTDCCEPDARQNYCEACGKQTVQSALVLAEII